MANFSGIHFVYHGKKFIGSITSGKITEERSRRNANVLYIFRYSLIIFAPINVFKK